MKRSKLQLVKDQKPNWCRLQKLTVAIAVYVIIMVSILSVPTIVYAVLKSQMKDRYEYHLGFWYDGDYYGNDDAPTEKMYVVERYDKSKEAYIDLTYHTQPNRVVINARNIKNISIHSRAIFKDECRKVFGFFWTEDTNYYKTYFMERGMLEVVVNSDNYIQNLTFIDVPRLTWNTVNGIPFYNYVFWGENSYSAPMNYLYCTVRLYFKSPPPAGQPPVAEFTTDRTRARTNVPIFFDASASYDTDGYIVEYYWDFGDGTYGYGQTIVHAYATTQFINYSVILVVKDNDGLTDFYSKKLIINEPDVKKPDAEISSPTQGYICRNVTFNIKDVGTADFDIYTYKLQFYNYATGLWTTLAYQYSTEWRPALGGKIVWMSNELENRAYRFRVEVVDENNLLNYTPEVLLTVDNINPVAAAGPDQVVNEDELCVLNASTSYDNIGIVNYTWYFGDGTVGYGMVVTHTYSIQTVYTATLIVWDAAGNTGTDTVNITVLNVVPHADAGGDKFGNEYEYILFEGSNSTDTPSDFPKLMYLWSFGDGRTAVGKTVLHRYDDDGIYNVNLTVADDNGATAISKVKAIIRNLPPSIERIEDKIACHNYLFTMRVKAHDVPADKLTYYDDTHLFDIDEETGIITFLPHKKDAGKYRITITVRDDEGATAKTSFNLTIVEDKPPYLKKALPSVDLRSGELKINVFNLDDYFADDDEEPLAYTVIGAVNISVIIDLKHRVSLKAPVEWEGVEIVRIRATDPLGVYAEGEMVVRVKRVNSAPYIAPLPDVYVHTNYVWELDLTRYVFDDYLPAVRVNTSSKYVYPSGKSLTLLFYYTDENITFEFVKVFVNDGEFEASTSVNVSVSKENWPPYLLHRLPDVNLTEDIPLLYAFKLTDYFRDNETDVLTFTVTSNPFVYISIAPNSSVSFTPKEDWFGNTSVTFTARDQYNWWVEDTININVLSVNDPPKIVQTITMLTVKEGGVWKINLNDYFKDVDNPDLVFYCNRPEIEIDPHTGIVKWIPKKDDEKLTNIIFSATDGYHNVSTAPITITVIREQPFAINIFFVIIAAIIASVMLVGYRIIKYRYRFVELFLVNNAGILLAHISVAKAAVIDKKIVASMLTAVQDFVKDSFARGRKVEGEEEMLGKLEYGKFIIVIEHGAYTFLAAVISGFDNPAVRSRLRSTIRRVEAKYGHILQEWDGDMSKVKGCEKIVARLMKREKFWEARAERLREKLVEKEAIEKDMQCESIYTDAWDNFLAAKYEDALQLCDKALKLKSNYWPAVMLKAQLLNKKGDPTYEKWIERARAIDPVRTEEYLEHFW